jgi:acetolactate synthase I/II/III large subunit
MEELSWAEIPPEASKLKMMINGAQIFSRWLEARQHHRVFCLPGLQIDGLIMEISRAEGIGVTTASHEAGAGFMADGFAKASGRLGICLTIGNVGATNLATALLVAKSDQSPVLFVTGAPPLTLDDHFPFQDIGPMGSDDKSWIGHFVKSSVLVQHPDELLECLIEAERIALQYPKGPVHLIIPSCVQSHPSDIDVPFRIPDPEYDVQDVSDDIRQVLKLLRTSRRAAALVGNRAAPPGIVEAFADAFCIPIATTLEAKGLLRRDNPMCLGSFGFAGMPLANQTLLNEEIDLLILIGVELGERESHNWDPRLIEGKKIVSLASKISQSGNAQPFLAINGCCGGSLAAINLEGESFIDGDQEAIASRRQWVDSLREKYPFSWPVLSGDHPREVSADKLLDVLAERAVNLIIDAGSSRIYSGIYWWPIGARSFFSSYSVGAMGWSLGASLGVYLAKPTRPTVVLIGDGSMWMSGNELATLVRDRIPILIVVLNNSGYGTVVGRYRDSGRKTVDVIRTPEVDWCLYATSMSCQARKIESCECFLESVEAHFCTLSEGKNPGPLMLEVITPTRNALPAGAFASNGYQENPSNNGY